MMATRQVSSPSANRHTASTLGTRVAQGKYFFPLTLFKVINGKISFPCRQINFLNCGAGAPTAAIQESLGHIRTYSI